MPKVEEILNILPICNRYQLIVVITTAFICFRGCLQLYGISFISHRADHYCSLETNQTGNVSACHITDFSTNSTVECDSWDYFDANGNQLSKGYSIVTQWDLVCSRARMVTVDLSAFCAAQMVGGLFLSPLSDKFGRRPMIVYSLFLQLIFDVILIFSANMWMFVVIRFFDGILKQTAETSAYTLMAEWFPTRYRTVVSNGVLLTFSLGIVCLTALAYVFRNWRYLVLGYYIIPELAAIPLFFVLPESLMFLESQRRNDELKQYLSKFGINPSAEETELPNSVALVSESAKEDDCDNEKNCEEEKTTTDEPPQHTMGQAVRDIFSSTKMMSYTISLFWLSISLNLTYFITTMNTMTLSGNEYVNFALSGAIELPFVLVTSLISIKLPRLVLICGLYTIAGSCFVTSCFLPASIFASIVAFIGRGAIAGGYVVQILYACEMFPTVIRNAGVGLYLMAENLGPLFGPTLLTLNWHSSGVGDLYFALGIVALLNAFITTVLPETRKQMLPDTVEDVEKKQAFSIWRYCQKKTRSSEPVVEAK